MIFDCLAIPDNRKCNERIVCVFKGVPYGLNRIIEQHGNKLAFNNGEEYCHFKTNEKLQNKIIECKLAEENEDKWCI